MKLKRKIFTVLMALKTYCVVFSVITMCALISTRLRGVITHSIAVYNQKLQKRKNIVF
jgi:hypothetical protein